MGNLQRRIQGFDQCSHSGGVSHGIFDDSGADTGESEQGPEGDAQKDREFYPLCHDHLHPLRRRAFRAGRTDPDPAVRGQKPSSDLGGASSDGDCFRGSLWNVHTDQRHPAGNGPYAASGDPCRHFPGAACPAAGRPAYGGRSEYLCSGVGKYILCFSDVCTELPFDCKIHAVPAGGGPDIFDSSGSFRNHGSGGIRRS